MFSETHQQTPKRVSEVEKRVSCLCFTWKQGAALSFRKYQTRLHFIQNYTIKNQMKTDIKVFVYDVGEMHT